MILKIRYSRLLNRIPRVKPCMILGLGSFKKKRSMCDPTREKWDTGSKILA